MDVTRHAELFKPHQFEHPVHIIGLGATGSWLALQLAKLGLKEVTLWDYDMVEEHNIPNQAYGIPHMGFSKAKSLQALIHFDTGTSFTIRETEFIDQRVSGIVFLMVDTMKARKDIWENSIKMRTSIPLLVEPRMGLSASRVYNVEPTNLLHIKKYEDCWYSDDEAEVSSCGTSVSVVTTAMTTASWCARQLINFHNKVEMDNEILIDCEYNNIYPTKWE